MEWPTGATGFDPPPTDRPVAAAQDDDLRGFKAVCHHAARRTGGTVTAVIPAAVTPNFHTVLIGYRCEPVAVLKHATLPLVALAHPLPVAATTISFTDRPDLAQAISEVSNLRILTAEALQRPLSHVDLNALTGRERDQINYWRPHTVGELLFNFWD